MDFWVTSYIGGFHLYKDSTSLICIRISNSTGQSCFAGQRNRKFYIFPGKRDNGTSSKSCHWTGWDGILTFHHGTGRVSNGPGRDFDSLFCRVTGQDTEQWDKKRERNKTINEKKIILTLITSGRSRSYHFKVQK